MKKDPKNKLLVENLESLITKYSQSNVLDELAKNHLDRPVKRLSTSIVLENQFLKKITFSPSKLRHFVDNYQRNILLEPLIVRSVGDKYEVIIGRKRLAAAKLVKLEEIPVIVMNYNDEETLLILLARSRDSEGSNSIELAYIFSALVSKYNYSHESLARLAFLSRPQVSNILRLLKLPKDIIKVLISGNISFGHARALIGLEEEKALLTLEEITRKSLSVRETEALVKVEINEENSGDNPRLIRSGKKVTLIFDSEDEAREYFEKHR